MKLLLLVPVIKNNDRWLVHAISLVVFCSAIANGLERDIVLPLIDGVSFDDLCPYQFGVLSNKRLMEIDSENEEVNFSDRHIPHVSLFLTDFIDDKKDEIVGTVAHALQEFSNRTKYDSCEVKLEMADEKPIYSVGSGYAIWKIERTPCLQELSDTIVKALEPFVNKQDMTIPAWVQNLPEPQRSTKIKLIHKYGSPNVFSEFEPHVTVGYNTHTNEQQKMNVLNSISLPTNCKGDISKVGIGHVGKSGGTVLKQGLLRLQISSTYVPPTEIMR